MYILRGVLLAIMLAMVLYNCSAEGSGPKYTPEQEKELQELTKKLFKTVSESCKDELLKAIEDKKQVESEGCKAEVSEFWSKNPPASFQQFRDIQSDIDHTESQDIHSNTEASIKPKHENPPKPWSTAAKIILLLTALGFVSLTGYVAYYHSTHREDESKPKKLSKKKEEKLRSKKKL